MTVLLSLVFSPSLSLSLSLPLSLPRTHYIYHTHTKKKMFLSQLLCPTPRLLALLPLLFLPLAPLLLLFLPLSVSLSYIYLCLSESPFVLSKYLSAYLLIYPSIYTVYQLFSISRLHHFLFPLLTSFH